MSINYTNANISTNISANGNNHHYIVRNDSYITNTYISMACDEHIYELINAYIMYNKFNKAGFEVQLKYVIKNIEKIIHSIIVRQVSHYNMIEIYHIIKDFNSEALLNLFTNNIRISHLEGSSINSTEVEDYLEDSKKELNKIIKIKLIKNEI